MSASIPPPWTGPPVPVVEVEFIGGPLDGTVRGVPADADGRPDRHVFVKGIRLSFEGVSAHPGVHRYTSQPNPHDDGPLWHYRYQGEEPECPGSPTT